MTDLIRPVDELSFKFDRTCVRRGDTVTCADGDGKKISIRRATQLGVAGAHVCVLLAARTVACAGFRGRARGGQRPAGRDPVARRCPRVRARPVARLRGARWRACWGENRGGQLGDGTMTDRETATPV